MYHFHLAYVKVAGTERGGLNRNQPSTCFGAPFMRVAQRWRQYSARKLSNLLAVNTGWTGGAYGTGSRMPIKATRTLLTVALSGMLSEEEFRKDENFGSCAGA